MSELLLSYVNQIRIPSGIDKVFKDECVFCFDTPENEDGLFICMQTFWGLSRQYVEAHHRRTGSSVYLHIKRTKFEVDTSEPSESPKKKPTRLAIGLEGGFDLGDGKKYEYDESYSIMVLPQWNELPLTQPDIPAQIQAAAVAIIAADSASKLAELAALAGTWDGEKRIISKHAEGLLQLANGKQIPPHGWKCERCDLTDNLWLNLTDGSILCGRRFWDGTGGNNHASEHYATTQYPLAVKLGTITADGADVFSYVEDDMVEDPFLAQHLAHFGINRMNLEKTDKTMVEMELEVNQRMWEANAILESGAELQPLYGPGCTGIHNLGNSCYMNAVMQAIFTIPSFKARYYDRDIRTSVDARGDPTTDFNVQMTKFAHGLLSGDYCKPPNDAQKCPQGVRPVMFKSLIGAGHPEFSTKRQQDAHEYLLHLFTLVERNSRGSVSPTEPLKFRVEDRVECMQSGQVKYLYRDDYALALPIPLDAMTNAAEVAEYERQKAEADAKKTTLDPSKTVRPIIAFSSCVETFAAPAVVDNFYSSAIQGMTTAKKSTRLSTMPDYLFLHMQKFTVGNDWVERKLDVSVQMPDTIDLSQLRGRGKQPGEVELKDVTNTPAPAVEINDGFVAALVDMGFPFNACRKAVYHTKNLGVENAMNWLMEHMDDIDFDSPLQLPAGQPAGTGSDQFMPDEESLVMIMGMGFTRPQAVKALKATDNNLERAADWIFNHAAELDQEDLPQSVQPAPTANYTDGPAKYRLVAFVSHIGTSTKAGHYVCHVLKDDGRWVLFNDEKVAVSEHPPKDLAYLYLYRRL